MHIRNLAALAAAGIAVAAAVAVVAQQAAPDPPKSIAAALKAGGKPKPGNAAPTREQQVAVVTIVQQPDGTARVERVRVVNAVPPKVFARSRGDWEVRLVGRTPAAFRMPNPFTDIEVENPGNERTPYSQVRPAGALRTEVMVPLSQNGRSLGVSQIEIVDVATGRPVLVTGLNGGPLPPTGQPGTTTPGTTAPPSTTAPR